MIESHSLEFFEYNHSSQDCFLSNFNKAHLQNMNSKDSFRKQRQQFFNELLKSNQKIRISNQLYSKNSSNFAFSSEFDYKKSDPFSFEFQVNSSQLKIKDFQTPLSVSNINNKMDDFIDQYVQDQSLSSFSKHLIDDNYTKPSLNTAVELINSIIKQPEENSSILDNLVNDLYFENYFTDDQLKMAFSNIANSNKNNEKIGKSLVHIYSLLVTDEILSFDDFEELFMPMKSIWSTIIPYFFVDIDQRLGTWMDGLSDSKFWSEMKFIDSSSYIDIIDQLKEWNIIDLFPEFDIACSFLDRLNTCADPALILRTSDQMSINHEKLTQIVFEILSSLNESQMEKMATNLKQWFSPYSDNLLRSSNFAQNEQKLLLLLQ